MGVGKLYIPDNRTLRLIEIQESVLPEEEWLIGISDMGYFKGVGFSMPVSKDSAFVSDFDQMSITHDEIIFEEYDSELDPLLIETDQEISEGPSPIPNLNDQDPEILPSDVAPFIGPHLFNIDDSSLLETVGWEAEKSHLYAFLPGLFYCSNQATTVDGVAIQVTEKEMLGMTLSSFRPEDVRSIDVSSGIIFDDDGLPKSVAMTVDTLGKFDTDLVLGDTSVSHNIVAFSDKIEDPYESETYIASKLAQSIPLIRLKEAYVSGSFLENRLMKLIKSIDEEKLQPRFRIYVRNEKYPNGKVVNIRYRCIDAILDLIDETGILCPDEFDLSMELRNLLFLKLAENPEEVDIERAVLEIYDLLHTKLGRFASKEQIVKLLFTKESSRT
jgi:hypothetical protein